MSQAIVTHKPVIDWLTVAAIAAIAISLTVASHEGVHALTCLATGDRLLEYSALYESCDSTTELGAKLVAGSAPTYNLIAGALLWLLLRRTKGRSPETRFFLWLFMMMNWCYGAGYFIVSGVVNIGDWAVVIDGWEPSWLWRVLMTITGVLLFMVLIRLTLQAFGKLVGGAPGEQLQRANKLFIGSYITSFAVVMSAGFFCPYGLTSLPVTAGVAATLGALSPLLWMVRWFRTEHFQKLEKEPLEIHRKWHWLAAGGAVTFLYVFVLGRTLYF